MWSWTAQYKKSVSFLRLGARWLPLNSSFLKSCILNSYILTRHRTNIISRPPGKNSLIAILNALSMLGIYLNSPAALANDYRTKVMIVGGVTDVTFSTTGSIAQYLKAIKIKVRAVTTWIRSKTELQIPTIAQSGIPSLADYGVTVWYGLIGPKNLSAELIQKLNSGLKIALKNPQTIALFKTTGDEAAPSSAEEFKTIMSDEIQLWRKVVTQAKIKVESTN